jgi:putative heme-binding domain-containing protein
MPSRFLAARVVALVAGATISGLVGSEPRPAPRPFPFRAEAFALPPQVRIDLVAAEPQVIHPIAIDWAADGGLWVAEAGSSAPAPSGAAEPVGRVSLLRRLDRDGRYEEAAVFLDAVSRPTSVLAWGRGVLICAAPDLLYAEDTNGDGRADVAERLWIGFSTENPEQRLNSLSLGLDGWVYGASGPGGGTIHALDRLDPRSRGASSEDVVLAGHDFRFRPERGEFELASGMSARARARDAWGNWFGLGANDALSQYPLAQAYQRRNPAITFESAAPVTMEGSGTNRFSGASSLAFSGKDQPGPAFEDHAWIAEPDARRVRRLIVRRDGLTFRAADTEPARASSFLTSSDPDFEPVQVRAGPDGALWVVDRRESRPSPGNVGEGRIYRVFASGQPPRQIRNLAAMKPEALAAALDTPNPTERDRIQRRLQERMSGAGPAPDVFDRMRQMVRQGRSGGARAQALAVLNGLGALTPAVAQQALADAHPGVRVQAIRTSESLLEAATRAGAGSDSRGSTLRAALLRCVDDPDPAVRFQLACSLGEWPDPSAGQALGRLARSSLDDGWMRLAILSSASRFPDEILRALLEAAPVSRAAPPFEAQLVATAAGSADPAALDRVVALFSDPGQTAASALRMDALAGLLDALERRVAHAGLNGDLDRRRLARVVGANADLLSQARQWARDGSQPLPARRAALRLLGHESGPREDDLRLLMDLTTEGNSVELRLAALESLLGTGRPAVATLLVQHWLRLTPAARRQVIGSLVARDDWAAALVEAVRQGVVATSEITPANRERLLNHEAAGVREKAATVFAANLPAHRTEFLEKFQGALALSGVPAKGRLVFEANCSRCHAVAGLGHAVGPDLAALRNRTTPEMFGSILDPSALIEPAFVPYQIETEDGESLSGLVKGESDTTLTLLQGGGAETVIPRTQITEIRASNLSLMPEGLEQSMKPADLADLLAFLRQSQQ